MTEVPKIADQNQSPPPVKDEPQAHFADLFWTPDYKTGIETLFNKLFEGCNEDQEVLDLVEARIELEEIYASKLAVLPSTNAPDKEGFGAIKANDVWEVVEDESEKPKEKMDTVKFDPSAADHDTNTETITTAPKQATDEVSYTSKRINASLLTQYESLLEGMSIEGQSHQSIATNLKQHVKNPFSEWSLKHYERVQYSYDRLMEKVKFYEKQNDVSKKAQLQYFAKCRALEDNNRPEKDINKKQIDDFLDTDNLVSDEVVNPIVNSFTSLSRRFTTLAKKGRSATIGGSEPPKSIIEEKDEEKDESKDELKDALKDESKDGDKKEEEKELPGTPIETAYPARSTNPDEPTEIGKLLYYPPQLHILFQRLLLNIPRNDYKLPLIGTYPNVSTGADISNWLRKNVGSLSSLAKTEKFGQDLINLGYLRLVGAVGNKFTDTADSRYQWQSSAFKVGKLEDGQEKKTDGSDAGSDVVGMSRASTLLESFVKRRTTTSSNEPTSPSSHSISTRVPTTTVNGTNISVFDKISNSLRGTLPGESYSDKLIREMHDSDTFYQTQISQLNFRRQDLEESILSHFQYMEKCEISRLEAIKTVMQQIMLIIKNQTPLLHNAYEIMGEPIPLVNNKLGFESLIKTYGLGFYSPRKATYINYYNSSKQNLEIFGVELGSLTKGRDPPIPEFLITLLEYLEELESKSEISFAEIWKTYISEKSLQKVHNLENKTVNSIKENDGIFEPSKVFKEVKLHLIVGILELYLLELPDSLIPFTLYDKIKSIYESDDVKVIDEVEKRQVLAKTLAQLPWSNLATLNTIIAHLNKVFGLRDTKGKSKAKAEEGEKKEDDSKNDDDDDIFSINLIEVFSKQTQFGHFIMRPRIINGDSVVNGLNIKERVLIPLLTDLLTFGDSLFRPLLETASEQFHARQQKLEELRQKREQADKEQTEKAKHRTWEGVHSPNRDESESPPIKIISGSPLQTPTQKPTSPGGLDPEEPELRPLTLSPGAPGRSRSRSPRGLNLSRSLSRNRSITRH